MTAAPRSQPLSAVTVTCTPPAAASQVARGATFGLHPTPAGDAATRRASVMNGAGIASTAGPPTPSRENTIDPPGRRHGTSPPPTSTPPENAAAAPAAASVIDPLTPCGIPSYDSSAPAA